VSNGAGPAPIARQGATFAVVGALATATHLATALLARKGFGASPMAANFAGYAASVGVSYLGNARFTFGRPALHGAQFVRFLVVSLAGLCLNQAITWLMAVRLGLPFWVALGAVVTVVPVFSFLVSRLWAFRER
jgi:putative flippase GtrA